LESIRLPIRQVSHAGRTDLSLEGTVLVVCERRGGMQSEVQVPVELISIWERSRFKGARLIWALLALLLPLLAAGLLGGLFGAGESEREPPLFVFILFVMLLLGGCIAFGVLLVRFFFRVPTVCLTVAPSEQMIEFWRNRRDSQTIDDLLEQIEQRQKLIEETFASPVKSPIAMVDEPSLVRKFLVFLYMSFLPALITQKIELLSVAVLPVTWFLYRQSQYRSLPAEYRRAFRSYLKRDWNGAVASLTGLLQGYPDYIPAYALLAHVYTRWGRFDEALRIVSQLSGDWSDMAQDMQTEIWRFKRMAERRKDPGPTTGRAEANSGEGEP
jgi:tetratricopeptide (TPR) repeat protein